MLQHPKRRNSQQISNTRTKQIELEFHETPTNCTRAYLKYQPLTANFRKTDENEENALEREKT